MPHSPLGDIEPDRFELVVDAERWTGTRAALADLVAAVVGRPALGVRAALGVPGSAVAAFERSDDAESAGRALADAGVDVTVRHRIGRRRPAAPSSVADAAGRAAGADVIGGATMRPGWTAAFGADGSSAPSDRTLVGAPLFVEEPDQGPVVSFGLPETGWDDPAPEPHREAPSRDQRPPTPAPESEASASSADGALPFAETIDPTQGRTGWQDILGTALAERLVADDAKAGRVEFGDGSALPPGVSPWSSSPAIEPKPPPIGDYDRSPPSAFDATPELTSAAGAGALGANVKPTDVQPPPPPAFPAPTPAAPASESVAVSSPAPAQPIASAMPRFGAETPADIGDLYVRLRPEEPSTPTITPADAIFWSVLAPGGGFAYLAEPRRGLRYAIGSVLLIPWVIAAFSSARVAAEIEAGRRLLRKRPEPALRIAYVAAYWTAVATIALTISAFMSFSTRSPTDRSDRSAVASSESADEPRVRRRVVVVSTTDEQGSIEEDAEAAARAESERVDELVRDARDACDEQRWIVCQARAEEALAIDQRNRPARLLHARAVSQGVVTPALPDEREGPPR